MDVTHTEGHDHMNTDIYTKVWQAECPGRAPPSGRVESEKTKIAHVSLSVNHQTETNETEYTIVVCNLSSS